MESNEDLELDDFLLGLVIGVAGLAVIAPEDTLLGEFDEEPVFIAGTKIEAAFAALFVVLAANAGDEEDGDDEMNRLLNSFSSLIFASRNIILQESRSLTAAL